MHEDLGDAMKITAADIGNVLNGLISSGENALQQMGQSDLDKEHWHFVWDDAATLEHNIYHFHDMLELYGSFCRRWEEKRNGTCCVVERVRDTYLMPKIREFAAKVRASSNAEKCARYQQRQREKLARLKIIEKVIK